MDLSLAENIRTYRKQRHLTQEQLAEVLGVTTGAVYKWEAGISFPELSLIVELADFFDVSLNAFLILFCLVCLLIGLLVSFVNIPINTVLMRVVEKDKLGKVSSILSIISQGLTPIASVLAGAILQLFGSTVLLAVCSAGFTLTALFLLFNQQVRNI